MNEAARTLLEVTENKRQFYVIGDFSGSSISVDMDAATDSVMIAAQTGGASGRFNQSGTTTTAFSGNTFAFGFRTQAIKMFNNGAEDMEFSFDGTNVHGVVESNGAIGDDDRHETNIWFRSTSGGVLFRVEAY